MEVTTAAAATTPPPPSTKSPEAESDRIYHHHQSKPIPISNGVLKRHHPPCSSHHQQTQQEVTYKECLKNHAASLGGHALDGCGEFLPSPDSNPTDPTSLKCAVCGCHRNFHRRDPIKQPITHRLIEYHPHHRHHPPPPPHSQSFPPQRPRSPNSQSPPPISSSYYPASAPHMLLALSGGGGGGGSNNNNRMENSGLMMTHPSRKRFRTKFSQEQKEKMYEFAEKVGWKMQKSNEEMVNEFCTDVGVERGVLKVWMHNNKNTFGKRLAVDVNNSSGIATACAGDDDDNNRRNGEIYPHQGQHNHSGGNNKSPEHHFRSSNENADVSNSSYSS